jgi:acetoacetyl-CoA synthetase
MGSFARRWRPEAVGDYQALWDWSVREPGAFWSAVWEHFDIRSDTPATQVRSDAPMPHTTWFDGVAVNYAEHALRSNGRDDRDVAVPARSQSRPDIELTLTELRTAVRDAAAGLRRLGVRRGDRVAAYLPNIPEAVVGFLATASIGAIWSSCAPEFGTQAVLDRWSQIQPSVLLTIDGYRYGDKAVDLSETIAAIRRGLPSLDAAVVLPYLDGAEPIPNAIPWDSMTTLTETPLTFERVPFGHPLYVLYSSGTTGLPKAILHGHGGMLLEHSKQLSLHMDLGPHDRFFWFSTTGWMMWNFLVSGLLVGAAIVLFDGNPGHPNLDTLWTFADDAEVTFFGTSAPFIMACRDAGIAPASAHRLHRLTALGSTGAPLPAAGFHWAAEHIGTMPLFSISGGTDVCSAFLGGTPVLPVTAGVIPCRQLGWDISAYSASGEPITGAEGELVITSPAPSMPVGFWGDEDNEKYRRTYFDTFPNVWRHGDWITIADDGSCIVSGRSDATLNRGGVRLGTADFYAVVEADPDVADSLVVHLEDVDGGLGELILFVTPAGEGIDDACRRRLSTALRGSLSPRHVPDEIRAMPSIPRTLSGKKLEIPVKKILQGLPVEQAASRGALADPTALDPYRELATARSALVGESSQ